MVMNVSNLNMTELFRLLPAMLRWMGQTVMQIKIGNTALIIYILAILVIAVVARGIMSVSAAPPRIGSRSSAEESTSKLSASKPKNKPGVKTGVSGQRQSGGSVR